MWGEQTKFGINKNTIFLFIVPRPDYAVYNIGSGAASSEICAIMLLVFFSGALTERKSSYVTKELLLPEKWKPGEWKKIKSSQNKVKRQTRA